MTGSLDGFVDLYSVLGLNTNCTAEQVRQRYAELSKLYHPDKAANDEQRELNNRVFQHITVAYKTLANDKKRLEYTRLLQSQFGDLKGDYLNGSLETRQVNEFDLDRFNNQFEENLGEAVREKLKSAQTDSTSLETLLALRQQDDTRRVCLLERKINIDETRDQLDAMYKKVKHYADHTGGALSLNTEKLVTLSGDLLMAIGNIRDNFRNNPVLLVELIALFSKLDDIQLSEIGLDRQFVDQLREQLDYTEYDNNGSGPSCEIAPFESEQTAGAPVNCQFKITADLASPAADATALFGGGTLLQ